MLVGGGSGVGFGRTMVVARYGDDGAPDPTFNGTGNARVTTQAYDGVIGRRLALQPDGRILIAGTAGTFGSADFMVARLEPDGTHDTGFGSDGLATVGYGQAQTNDFANGVGVDGQGRILVGGHTGEGFAEEAGYELAVARLQGGDDTPPETYLTYDGDQPPPSSTRDPTPTYAFGSPEPGATFECRVDGGAFAPCTSPYTTPPLADGVHGVEVRAADRAGNVDPTPAHQDVTIDTTGPDTAIDAGPQGTTDAAQIVFQFSSPEGSVRFECRLDGAPYAACESPYTTAPLGELPLTFGHE
ncbi:MAG TPA: hypothetical protein VF533_00170, partial [Solirubrobacteraceae bacterium]